MPKPSFRTRIAPSATISPAFGLPFLNPRCSNSLLADLVPIQVHSEIGRLRRVLVHRPGREIDRMVPSMMESLLFDDILFGDDAREEHEAFRRVLEIAGAEVLDPQDLLAEVLAEEGPRRAMLAELEADYGASPALIARLSDLDPRALAATLVEGVISPFPEVARRDIFDLVPVPNYFFQRDPLLSLGDRVVVSSMATDAREREPLLNRMVLRHHPRFVGANVSEIDVPPSGAPQHDPHFPYPTLEGGDVLLASEEIVCIGVSERTNGRGVDVFAQLLRARPGKFRHLVLVELPSSRSYMHLDTVFTFIDHGLCLAHMPVIEPGRSRSARVFYVDLTSRELTYAVRPSLLAALADLGLDLEVVPCGGADALDQEREQWTDGANAFAVAPGVILLYRRNRRTMEELSRRGWRILEAEDVIAGRVALLGEGPTVVSLLDNELSRARGGPRCMTMPLEREAL